MGRVAKIWTAVKRWVQARFEGVIQKWGERSLLGQALQDARLDVSSWERKEFQRRHRYWVSNSALVQRIRNLFIQFSVGVSGLHVVPNSENEDWNNLKQASWDRWGRAPDANTFLPIGQVCIQWAGALFDDGEIFIHKAGFKNGAPMIENIEAHRVETPSDLKNEEGKTIFDGIRYNGSGRPLTYFVRKPAGGNFNLITPASDGFDQIPAEDMIHLFKARRPGQLRGIPEGFSTLNTLHDYEDLHLLEMQVAKMAAEIGNVETNPTGELDMAATRRVRMGIASPNASGNVAIKNADQFYHVTIGARKIALKAGDTLKQFQVDRPSIATQQYWDLLINQICCGYNVPKLLVVPYSLQGTVTRADLDICANAFRFNFELIAWALRQIYEWQSEWAVKFDRTLRAIPTPPDYLECIIRPPRAPNVDIGYTAQALQVELQIGTKTLQDVYAERQQDWRHQLRQIAETESFIDSLADEFGIDAARISQKAKNPTPEKPQEEPTETPETETA